MSKKKPAQFVYWLGEEGVFRPASLERSKRIVSYRIKDNISLKDERIKPAQLGLVASVGLGSIDLEIPRNGNIVSKSQLENEWYFRFHTAQGIVLDAQHLADHEGVPYFAVNVVETQTNRLRKPMKVNDFVLALDDKITYNLMLKDKNTDSPDYFGKMNEPGKEPIRRTLHPTVQLYVDAFRSQ